MYYTYIYFSLLLFKLVHNFLLRSNHKCPTCIIYNSVFFHKNTTWLRMNKVNKVNCLPLRKNNINFQVRRDILYISAKL